MDHALLVRRAALPAPNGRAICARARRICLIVLALCVINTFDLLMTLQASRQGLLVEANPIAHRVLMHGPAALIIYKILLVGFGSSILLWQRGSQLAEWLGWLVVVINVGVCLRWMSCYVFYEVTLNGSLFLPLSVLTPILLC